MNANTNATVTPISHASGAHAYDRADDRAGQMLRHDLNASLRLLKRGWIRGFVAASLGADESPAAHTRCEQEAERRFAEWMAR